MKISDVLNESMEFGPTRVEKRKFNGEMHDVSVSPGSMQDVDCSICDGAGYNVYNDQNGKPYKDPCGLCRETGKENVFVGDGPDMNVSNANGWEIQRMIGVDPDHGGHVWNKDLPDLMRRLIKLKNGDTSQHAKEPNVELGRMQKRAGENGLATIGRGATMHDMGRSQEQVSHYVDRVMKIVKWCIDNDYDFSWG